MIDLMYSGIYYSTYLEDRVYNEAITSEGEIDSEHKGINVIRYDILGMKELERFGVDLEGDDERDIFYLEKKEIFDFATMQLRAQAQALESLMGQDGFVNPAFKLPNTDDSAK